MLTVVASYRQDLHAYPFDLVAEDTAQGAFTGLAAGSLLPRTFSYGCAALTGVGAVSNGVPAFRKPESSNAATTLLLMGIIAGMMLIGIITLGNLIQLCIVGVSISRVRSRAINRLQSSDRRVDVTMDLSPPDARRNAAAARAAGGS